MKYNFDEIHNRLGTYCTQWDFIEDRFGEKELLPFSISDTDFKAPEPVIESSSEAVKVEQKPIPVSVKEENIIKNDVHDNNVTSEKKARSAKERLLEAKELLDLGLISKEDYDKIKLEIMKNI